MGRILIIGCPGAGKSTLAKKIAGKLDLPLIHLDKLFWEDNWTAVSEGIFDEILKKELEKDSWVIDGNYTRTLEPRIKRGDLIIFLDYSRLSCLFGVIKRTLKYRGQERDSMGSGCKERFDFEFFKYTWDFNKNNRSKIYEIINKYPNKELIILRSRKEGEEFLSGLE